MASAWGNAFGSAWGNAWGTIATVSTPRGGAGRGKITRTPSYETVLRQLEQREEQSDFALRLLLLMDSL